MTVDCARMAKTRFPKSKVQSSIFDFDSETPTIYCTLIYSFIYYSIYMLHHLKFFHRKKVLKRPQFYYYKLIESYGYMCIV